MLHISERTELQKRGDLEMDYSEMKKPIMFLLVVFLVSLALLGYLMVNYTDEGVVKMLHYSDIMTEYILGSLELAVVIYGIYKHRAIRDWLARIRHSNIEFPDTGKKFEVPKEKVVGAVIPVSRPEQPEWIIQHLKPKKIGLLYTDMSKDHAAKLVQKYQGEYSFILDETEIHSEKYMVRDPDDPAEAKKVTREYIGLFKKEGISRDQIFVDTTGGKVPMSIGSFQAAEEEGVSSIYVVGNDRGFITDPSRREHGSPIFLSDKT